MLQVATDKSLTCAVSQLNRPSLFISGFKKTRKNRISKAKSDFTCYSHLFFIQPFWQLIPQETTMFFLCFDRPETNNCYCVIQWSASFSKTGYIWGQGFTPSYIISCVLIFLFSCKHEAIPLDHGAAESLSVFVFVAGLSAQMNRHDSDSIFKQLNVNQKYFSTGVFQHWGFLEHLGITLFCHVHSCTLDIIINMSSAQVQGSRSAAERWHEMVTSLAQCHWAAWWQAEGMQGGTAGWQDKNNTSVNFCCALLANGNMLAFSI